MSIFFTIVVFIIIFSVLILIHELGHFFAAKRAGIKVEEFGFGLPPRLFGKKIGETIYSLNLFPFGGFVRLNGEDAHDPGALKNPHSFAGKSLRQRIWVVVAGVLMNFFLAILLLTVGFSLGIEPLLTSSEDVFRAVDVGVINARSGLVVSSVDHGSAAEKAGFQAGDVVTHVDSRPFLEFLDLKNLIQHPADIGTVVRVFRSPSFFEFRIFRYEGDFGLGFYDHFFLPRIVVSRLESSSALALAGLQTGDILLRVHSKNIYSVADYESAIQATDEFSIVILRDFQEMTFQIRLPPRGFIAVSHIVPGSPAEQAGLQKNDRIVRVDGFSVRTPPDVIQILADAEQTDIPFLIERDDGLLTLPIRPDSDGRIGVFLSSVYQHFSDSSFYATSVPTSVLEIHKVQYPVFKAFLESFREAYHLGGATLSMLGNLVQRVVTDFDVPEGVAGPVGIAQMTGVFLQEGFLSLLRFTALLSFSLAVMNLLPFPGLDGGRLLFLIIEGIRGRRVPARMEHAIHSLGFILLLILILLVTYKDIVRIFAG